MEKEIVQIKRSTLVDVMHHLRTSEVKGADVPDFYAMLVEINRALKQTEEKTKEENYGTETDQD